MTPEQVATWAAGAIPAALAPSQCQAVTEWADRAAVASLVAGGQAFYGYPQGAAACIFSITPATGQTQIESAILRWRGDLRTVPRQALPPGPLRCSVRPDQEAEVVHLGTLPVATHYRLTMQQPPAAPAGVAQWETPPDWVRPCWHACWAEHVGRGVDSPEAARERAEAELADRRYRWFTVDQATAACSLAVPSSYVALISAYVHPDYRGHGLQRALIRARLAWGWELGLRLAITQVALPGPASSLNLEAEGFRAYSTVHVIP